MLSGRFGFSLGVLLSLPTLATPAYAEPSSPDHKRRDVISPDETGSMPRGFHVESRLRYGPLIGGAITTGLGAMMLAAGLGQRADSQKNTGSVEGTPGAGGEFFIIPGAITLAVGLPLLAYGLISRREVYVRDSASPLQLGFSVDAKHVAGGLTYAF